MLTSLLGGIGLFLLGMSMMTDGLKLAAGGALRDLLRSWTRSAGRGLLAGATITAVVQSSSAVTVATVGFVNAGLLTLSQAVWVIFGTNVGTTMTGWLVALIGVKVDAGALALPMIGVGMLALLLVGWRSRRAGAAQAVAGFGVFFLGINVLQGGFAEASVHLARANLAESGWLALFGFVALGMLLTVVTQSSSAAIALVLTASAGGSLPLALAAAAVIGTNIGTTSTAAFAALNATPAAKRVASAHILFNLATALAALVLLVPVLALSRGIAGLVGGENDLPAVLAIFHTLFNCLGVLLMWPLTDRLVHFLQTRFVSPIEGLAAPVHLDSTLLSVSSLALRGLVLEIMRMSDIALRLARRRIESPTAERGLVVYEHDAVLQLGQAIRDYLPRLSASPMSDEVVKALPDLLRSIQHLEDLATTSQELGEHHARFAQWNELREAVLVNLNTEPSGSQSAETSFESRLLQVDRSYQQVKASLLQAAASGILSVGAMEQRLSEAQTIRRCAEAAIKAERRLSPWIVAVNGGAAESAST